MALHAGLVFRGQNWQGRSFLVTGPTVFMPRYTDVEAVFLEPRLVMRAVTLKAVFVFLWFLDPFAAVGALLQGLQNLLMAGETLLDAKKIPPVLVNVQRVRVHIPFSHVFMTVLAGSLAMRRDVKSRGINQPGGPGVTTTQRDGGKSQYCYYYDPHGLSSQTWLPIVGFNYTNTSIEPV
jgi:hypothetical protein